METKKKTESTVLLDTPKKANVAMFWLLLYMIVVQIGYSYLLVYVLKVQDFANPMVQFGNQIIVFLLPIIIYFVVTGKKSSLILPTKDLSVTNFFLIVGMAVTVQPIMMLLSGITSLFVNNDVSDLMINMLSRPNSIIINLFVMALTPAILEELVFRGVLLSGYKGIKLFTAAAIGGLFFGIMHLNPSQFLYAFVLGMAFVYLVHYTRSIFASILAHFVINGVQLMLSYFSVMMLNSMPEDVVQATQASLTDATSVIMAIIFAAILVVLTSPFLIALVYLFIKKNKNNDIKLSQERYLVYDADEKVGRDFDVLYEETQNSLGESYQLLNETPDIHGGVHIDNEDIDDENIDDKPKKVVNWAFFAVIGVYLLYIIGMQVLSSIR